MEADEMKRGLSQIFCENQTLRRQVLATTKIVPPSEVKDEDIVKKCKSELDSIRKENKAIAGKMSEYKIFIHYKDEKIEILFKSIITLERKLVYVNIVVKDKHRVKQDLDYGIKEIDTVQSSEIQAFKEVNEKMVEETRLKTKYVTMLEKKIKNLRIIADKNKRELDDCVVSHESKIANLEEELT